MDMDMSLSSKLKRYLLLGSLFVFLAACMPDTDKDGIVDIEDNCPTIANENQTDTDGNGVGDACQDTLATIVFSNEVVDVNSLTVDVLGTDPDGLESCTYSVLANNDSAALTPFSSSACGTLSATDLMPQTTYVITVDLKSINKEDNTIVVTSKSITLITSEAPLTVDLDLITDVNLKTCLEASWNRIVSGVTYIRDVKRLSCRDQSVTQIEGIEQFVSLRSLSLRGNQITDITLLSHLTLLNYAELGENEIVDIAPLTELTLFQSLFLDENKIEDVTPLADLTRLKILNVEDNEVTDIAPLSNLNALNYLFLDRNNITNVSALSNLTALYKLDLENNPVSCVAIDALSLVLTNTEITQTGCVVEDVTADLSLITDTNFKSCLEGSPHNIVSGVTPATDITYINCNLSSTVEIKGIEQFSNLVSLSLFKNQITDTTALASLTKLTSLDLNNNQITDITALKELVALKTLTFTNNKVIHVAALEGLTSLTNLQFADNFVQNIDALKNLTALTMLYVPGNQILCTEIDALDLILTNVDISREGCVFEAPKVDLDLIVDANLKSCLLYYPNFLRSGVTDIKNVKQISCNQLKIEDVRGIEQFSNLESLSLRGNQIADVSPLANLTELISLNIESNQVVDISTLKELKALKTLTFTNNQVTSIAALEGLTGLTNLQFAYNSIINIDALKNLTGLTGLSLINNEVPCSDIDALDTLLTKLTIGHAGCVFDGDPYVDLELITDENFRECLESFMTSGITRVESINRIGCNGKAIKQIEGIEQFFYLTSLEMYGNEITNIDPVENLTNINYLSFFSNQIMSVEPLKHLIQLRHLVLTGNTISSVEALKPLTSLARLYIGSNFWLSCQDLEELKLFLKNTEIIGTCDLR